MKTTKDQRMSNKDSNKIGLCEMTSGLSRLTEESHRYTTFQGLDFSLGVALFKVELWSSLGWTRFQASWRRQAGLVVVRTWRPGWGFNR